ncbi:MAG TPA: carbon-nitrogen hydrolase family protein, partial [Bacteroidia bacterium]|nr:carbon-nitrogen hydrolase family protein [Bacteroidia bacterium]
TGAQLLVFPEYGSIELLSLFPVNVQADIQQNLTALQPMLDDFCGTFADLATGNGLILIAPSLPVWVGDKFINRAHVFGKAGLAGWQDKFFMTRFEGEDWGISSSEKVLTLFQADWGSFGVQICYDVEFPLGSAGLCAAGAELIVVPSCTETIRGATRVHVGARARALENQCYTVVAQTVGEAPWSPVVDINFGYGAVYSPPDAGLPEEGIVALHPRNTAGWLDCRLDLGLLADVRRDGQVLNFRDGRQQQIQWAGEQVALRTARV